MLDDLLLLARPAGHSEILARRRAEVIRRRVRGIASLFAVLTLAWIPVDAAVFARSHWQDLAAARVAAAADAAHRGDVHLVLTARAENHLRGRPDLADTIVRLQSFQAAGADVLYAPGLTTPADIRAVVTSVDRPV
ncbi:MAG: isocitrate lyase/phosphoenolpyruvate mutase family protein, partial [Usitatibacter sp.]